MMLFAEFETEVFIQMDNRAAQYTPEPSDDESDYVIVPAAAPSSEDVFPDVYCALAAARSQSKLVTDVPMASVIPHSVVVSTCPARPKRLNAGKRSSDDTFVVVNTEIAPAAAAVAAATSKRSRK
jgi:Ni,Fe-hydrogenase III small subunit